MRPTLLFAGALLLTAPLFAQYGSGSSSAASSGEDVVELSPFSVYNESEPRAKMEGYIGVAGPNSMIVGRAPALSPGTAAVTILKRADAVAIQFVLSHTGDKQEIRNQELYASVSAIDTALKRVDGVRMEQREVRLTGGDKKMFSVSRGGSTTSFASLLVLADLPAGARLADRVKQIRDVLAATRLVGQTKYSDGSVGLYLKQPDQYRREILQKVFDDFTFMKKGFGEEFEIQPSGFAGNVRMRAASETEIELWLDYSFTFRSVRELESRRPGPEPATARGAAR